MPDAAATVGPSEKRPLDDLMLAMDVVDTLRHRAQLVERELGAERRDEQLIEKLRSIYAGQGIEVPDHVLHEGVRALKENRFTYAPPKPGLALTLAHVYVDRGRWARWAVAAVAAVAAVWLGYAWFISGPRNRLLRELPQKLATLEQTITRHSHVDSATADAKRLFEEGQQALAASDTQRAQRAVDALQDLQSRLDRQYDLRIVTQGSTGVWRVPDVNAEARNYYIIVQAVTPDGEALTLPVQSEEDRQVRNVDKWGLRVDEATFHAVAADKKDDGIIQNNRFGVKRAGYLEPEYLMPTTGGAITSW
jgi:hypothetical protein